MLDTTRTGAPSAIHGLARNRYPPCWQVSSEKKKNTYPVGVHVVDPYQRCSSQTINDKQYFLSLGVEFYRTWEGYRRVWLQGKNRLVSIFRLARFLDYETTECHKIIKSPWSFKRSSWLKLSRLTRSLNRETMSVLKPCKAHIGEKVCLY